MAGSVADASIDVEKAAEKFKKAVEAEEDADKKYRKVFEGFTAAKGDGAVNAAGAAAFDAQHDWVVAHRAREKPNGSCRKRWTTSIGRSISSSGIDRLSVRDSGIGILGFRCRLVISGRILLFRANAGQASNESRTDFVSIE